MKKNYNAPELYLLTDMADVITASAPSFAESGNGDIDSWADL